MTENETSVNEEQKKNREELIPKVTMAAALKKEAQKARVTAYTGVIIGATIMFLGVVPFVTLFIGGIIALISIWTSKKETDYIAKLNKVYGL